MKLVLRNRYLSNSRYNRYLIATGNDNDRARKLYNANIRLAQAFHPILSQFEVILRNSLNTILSSHFRDPDWIINQKNGFMRHLSLSPTFFLRNAVQKNRGQIKEKINSCYKWKNNFRSDTGILGILIFAPSLYPDSWSANSHFSS